MMMRTQSSELAGEQSTRVSIVVVELILINIDLILPHRGLSEDKNKDTLPSNSKAKVHFHIVKIST